MSDETFTLTGDRITRDSDGELVATFDAASGEFKYTHPQRKLHYSEQIEAEFGHLRTAPPQPAADNTPEASTEDDATDEPGPTADQLARFEKPPARHPQLGEYTADHLIHDHLHASEEAFAAKWDGPMKLSALRMIRETTKSAHEPFVDAIVKRLDH